MECEERIAELLRGISNNKKYDGCVFEASGIYFVITNDNLWEISDDVSCSPRGGWFPALISGPSEEEKKCLEKLMKKFEFDECFFDKAIDSFGRFYERGIAEYFEYNDDMKSLSIYEKIGSEIYFDKTPFDSMEAFASALKRYSLESGSVYYEWEGVYIDLYDNVIETGEKMGSYESFPPEEWISILEDIDSYIVTA